MEQYLYIGYKYPPHKMEISDIDIFLVEDDSHEAELVIRVLQKHNLTKKIVHFADSPEALDFLFVRGEYDSRKVGKGPKVILLDLKLPRVNGIEMLREIKTNELTRFIPVVVLTSSYEDRDIIECYKLGVNSYIIRPLPYDLFDKVIVDTVKYWINLNESYAALTVYGAATDKDK